MLLALVGVRFHGVLSSHSHIRIHFTEHLRNEKGAETIAVSAPFHAVIEFAKAYHGKLCIHLSETYLQVDSGTSRCYGSSSEKLH